MLSMPTFDFRATIWLWDSEGAWHFITLPKNVAKHIRSLFIKPVRGWGSVRVSVSIGSSEWETSIFPDKKSESFVLPIKLAVRKAEKLNLGDKPDVTITVLR